MSTEVMGLAALFLCPNVEPRTVRKYLSIWTTAEAAWNSLLKSQPSDCPIQKDSYLKLMRWRQTVSIGDVPKILQHYQIRMIVQGDENYPANLSHLADPPLVLFAKGDPSLIRHFSQSVAIVGTRRASGYGLEATAWISEVLARSGCVIVSGMAIGIDGQAHRSALEAGGKTIAVLGSGIDQCYPPSHRDIYHQITRHGLVLSEYAPTTPAAKHRFPERNRLIAALAKRVIVVQAGDRSGALRTADIALELGRDVYAVPGPITSGHHRGSNRLLQEGAGVITEAADLLEKANGQTPCGQLLEPTRWADLYQLVSSPMDAQGIAVALSRPVAQIYAGLLELELEGWIDRLPGGRYQQKGVRPG
jgi:DNA processing protein